MTNTYDNYLKQLTLEARLKADALGIPVENGNTSGHNDARDAFRHAYISARLARDHGSVIASQLGGANEMLGDVTHDQSPLEKRADIHNNNVGIAIAKTASTNDEIAQKVYDALSQGKLITNPESGQSPSNDDAYIPPIDIPNFQADSPGFFSSIGEEFSNVASSISNVFASISSSIGELFNTVQVPIIGINGVVMPEPSSSYRHPSFDPAQLTRILGGKRSANTNQILLTSATALARELARSRRTKMEESMIDIIRGNTNSPVDEGFGTPPIISNGRAGGSAVYNALENIVGSMLSRQRTRTTTYESERSLAAQKGWNLSQGQSAAMLAQAVKRGMRNL